MTKVKRGHRKRAWAPKVRSGCLTCKGTSEPQLDECDFDLPSTVRHVKCGEEFPVCHKCSASGFACEWPQLQAHLSQGDQPQLVRMTRTPDAFQFPLRNEDTDRALDLFRLRGIPMLSSGFFRCEFWERLVMQLTVSNDAIFHGTIALGLLFKDIQNWPTSWPIPRAAPLDDQARLSIQHYRLALRRLSHHLDGSGFSTHLLLTSCVIFASLETLFGNFEDGINLIMSGLNMMAQNGLINTVAGISRPLDAFQSLFLRLDIQVAEVDMTMHPTQIRPSMFSPLDEMPLPLGSLQEASDYIESLWNACIRLGIGQHGQCKRAKYRNLYDGWLRAFNVTPTTAQEASLSGHQYRISLIHLRRLDTYLALYGPIDEGAQTEWDRHMDAFTEMARHATAVAASVEMESAHFTMTGGILSPILRFVMRCRHPLVRRVGIDILRRLPRAEGPLTGSIASRILQRIVEIEEGLLEVRDCSDIPEESRVRWVSVALLGADGARLSYSRMNRDGSYAGIQEVIGAKS